MPATVQKPLKARAKAKPAKATKQKPPKAPPRPNKLPTKRELEADKAKLAKKVIAKQKPPAGSEEIPGVVEFIPELPADYDKRKRVRAQIEHMWDLDPDLVVERKPRTLGQAIVRALYCQGLRGDIRAFVEIRNTLGEAPTNKIGNADGSNLNPLQMLLTPQSRLKPTDDQDTDDFVDHD